jgi:hypothetical protein
MLGKLYQFFSLEQQITVLETTGNIVVINNFGTVQ